jgi:hypothetical protein
MTRQSTKKQETGWMPFYCGHPYWPLFSTKKEASAYAEWKGGKNNPKMTIRRCTVTRIETITVTVEPTG